MDNILNISDMRKFKFNMNMNSGGSGGGGNNRIGIRPKQNSTNSNNNKTDSQIDELKILMDLRKTSTLFKTAARNKI